jgi:uncharacterized protein YjbI with pentapeptide repeats
VANPEHLAKLNEGVEAWNQWREENPDLAPDLSGANLSEADLPWAHLIGANLREANLSRADFRGAKTIEQWLLFKCVSGEFTPL